jgi:ADP-ribose pyrophosphatase YjhB (NUDIX family)
VYFQNLPTLSAAAGFYITDRSNRTLLVKPTYRDHWAIPGGVVEHNEPPGQAAVREVHEELGLSLTDHPLLVVSWLAAHDRLPRPMIRFIFDGGTHRGHG